MPFVPEDFTIPAQLDLGWGHARKLCFRDAELDYKAVMSSVDTIQKTRGYAGEWPVGLTLEENMIDLGWHQREFENRTSFAYTIMNNDETECLGCFYLYPPALRGVVGTNAEVDVSFWVSADMYDKGYYPKLYVALEDWLKTAWPFKCYAFSNFMLPSLD